MVNKRDPKLCDDLDCTGCAACFNSCPADAIQMGSNQEGFYRPVIDAEKCIQCLKCERSCPVLSPLDAYSRTDDTIFAGWHNDSEIRACSSSGGVFSALAQTVLQQGGVVYGAMYDEDMVIHHARICNISELKKLRLSKYAQSSINSIFRSVKSDLTNSKYVLFCGTPCQCAGLRRFLNRDWENLVICDFICHGVPSPLMLKSYLNWLEEKEGRKIHFINFRDKRKGWYDALRVVRYEDKEREMKGVNDNFWIGFNNNINLQESCYNCHFLGEERFSDITIADFWGLGKKRSFPEIREIEKGVSAVIASTKKGEKLIKASKYLITSFPRTINELTEGNAAMIRSSQRPSARNSFYEDLCTLPYDEVVKKYLRPTVKQFAVKWFREFLPRPLIKCIRNQSQK